MANVKNFGLIGVGSDLQLGNGGGHIVWSGSNFQFTTDGTTLTNIRVATTPVNANDAASKAYVDSLSQGLDAKPSVRVATTAAGVLATDFAAGSVVDGVTLAAGDRILIKDQANATENGIYVVQASGAPTRATDADNAGDLSGGSFVFVEEGSTNADTGWVVSSNGSLTPGTDPISWVQFSSAGTITAGTGLSKTGTTLNVNVGATTVAVDGSNNLIVNSNATAGQPLLSAGTVGTEATFGQLDLSNTNAIVNVLGKANGGLGSDVSAFGVGSLFVNAAAGVTELAAGTDGNVLVMTAGSPAWGKVNLADATNSVTGTLPTTSGGTGLTNYTAGDVLYASSSTALATVPIGAQNTVLMSDGTKPVWGNPPAGSGSIAAFTASVTYVSIGSTLLGALPQNATVIEVRLNVKTAFNDPTTTITVGSTFVQDELVKATDLDPTIAATYVVDVMKNYPGGEIIHVFVNHQSATAGVVDVVLKYIVP
ncbi:MAG: hypothetical protein D6698_15180 [Gammaproteobacteria bacterium]|nr:MAG: hypothetical protein D6698_15180 [Gammaproteobacteria bacterium]